PFEVARVAALYFAFHWKYVARLIPCFRSSSATGSPASPSLRISTIWVSLNRDFRMGPSLGPAGESLRPSGGELTRPPWCCLSRAPCHGSYATRVPLGGGRESRYLAAAARLAPVGDGAWPRAQWGKCPRLLSGTHLSPPVGERGKQPRAALCR